MTPLGLRADDPAAIRIREAATRGTLSHALLFTGSGDRAAAARFAKSAAALAVFCVCRAIFRWASRR